MSVFSGKLEKRVRENGSRVVLALDLSPSVGAKDFKRKLLVKSRRILSDVEEHIVGVKINFQLLLPLGLFDDLRLLIEDAAHYGLPLIMDCKLNDVEHTNEWASHYFFEAGFDALIANPFVGWKGGLDSVFSVAKDYGKGVILLVYMSHPVLRRDMVKKWLTRMVRPVFSMRFLLRSRSHGGLMGLWLELHSRR